MKIEFTEPLLLTLAGLVLWLICTLIFLFVVSFLPALLLGLLAPAVGVGLVYLFFMFKEKNQ